MKAAIWTFVPQRDTSITPSDKVARIVSKLAKAPIVWNEDWTGKWPAKKTEVLFIVNGAFAFCKDLPAVAPAIRRAKRVIWIMNDYAVVPPKKTSIGESPFRAAFRKRAEAGLPDVEFWTTVQEYVTSKRDHYVNWNSLAYLPLDLGPAKRGNGKAVYYGYFRDYRKEAFDRYFHGDYIDVYSPSKDFKNEESYPKLNLVVPPVRSKRMPWEDWLKLLRTYSAGLYLEDTKSTASYHSPATRFFEMLGAGVPIAFDEPCLKTFSTWNQRCGYEIDVDPFIVSSRKELKRFMRHHREIARLQYKWRQDFYGDTVLKVKKLLRRVLE